MSWRDKAAPIIRRVLSETEGQPEADRRRALREAYPFGEKKYHPYRVWLDEIHAQKNPRPPRPPSRAQRARDAFNRRQLKLFE